MKKYVSNNARSLWVGEKQNLVRVNLLMLSLLMLCLNSCQKTWQVKEVKVDQYRMTNEMPSDSAINKIIEPYRKDLSKVMNVTIGESAVLLLKARPEGTLNNFVGDLLYERTTHYYGPIDFAIANYGGIRIPSIPPGPVAIGKVYELMPFDNQIVILKMKGALLQQLLDRIAERRGWAVSKQLRFEIAADKATAVTINGEPLDLLKEYLVSIPDYIANGGDSCDFLEAAERFDLNILVRDAMIEFVKKTEEEGQMLNAVLDGRIKYAEE
ncbi:MAG: 2',3'-cyclic-nucleotide 2'-phosphodiesterase (5'-nucleotidase family) [Polaribacter sp.]|jgi:2',3'-cyclic-nucleotide 2'-phosphodiesterase (5'-nucleotidase family)